LFDVGTPEKPDPARHAVYTMDEYLLKVENLKKYFPLQKGFLSARRGYVYAVDGVSFELKRGETLGIVGESGSGKSTLAKALLHLIQPTGGAVFWEGTDISHLSYDALRVLRRDMQMIFQDPYGSLDPRMKVGDIVGEGLIIHKMARGKEREERVVALLEKVGLLPDVMKRFPHELSGGQRQRVAIARAIALRPKLVVGDEPLSALDVSIQAQIVNLLEDLQKELHLSYLIISHDLSVIEHMCNKVAVMYLGKIVEEGSREEFYESPLHPYSRSLLASVPVPDPDIPKRRMVLKGDIPSPINPPSGCRFHPRCPEKIDLCQAKEPVPRNKGGSHWVACHVR
jgi:oligopeptide transport system ATP-binding protein